MVSWLQKISSGNESRAEGENDEMGVPAIAIAIEKKISTKTSLLLYFCNQGSRVNLLIFHWVKPVRIQIYSGPYFPAFGLNTEGYGVSLHILSECGKIRTRITPNTDTFHAVFRAQLQVLIISQNPIFRKLLCGLSEITKPIKFVATSWR